MHVLVLTDKMNKVLKLKLEFVKKWLRIKV